MLGLKIECCFWEYPCCAPCRVRCGLPLLTKRLYVGWVSIDLKHLKYCCQFLWKCGHFICFGHVDCLHVEICVKILKAANVFTPSYGSTSFRMTDYFFLFCFLWRTSDFPPLVCRASRLRKKRKELCDGAKFLALAKIHRKWALRETWKGKKGKQI